MNAKQDIDNEELVRRVIYALARAIVKMAAAFDLSLKDLSSLVEMAYFHELRSQGKTLRETSEALAVSQRKSVRLAKLLRENFIQPELEHNLPRRIEFMLWSQPMSTTRLAQVLKDVDAEAVEAAVQELLTQQRVEPVHSRNVVKYKPASALRKLPHDTWMRRIGALGSFVDNLADATYGRFFDRQPKAFARTLSFALPPGAHAELETWYEAEVLAKVIELSEAADESEERQDFQLSLCWAPYEYLRSKGDDS